MQVYVNGEKEEKNGEGGGANFLLNEIDGHDFLKFCIAWANYRGSARMCKQARNDIENEGGVSGVLAILGLSFNKMSSFGFFPC